MRFEFEHITVEVKDSTEGDESTVVVTIKAPPNHFQITNHLPQRGVIQPLDSELKQAARDTTTSSLRDAESLVSLHAALSKRASMDRTSGGERGGMKLVRVRRLK